MDTFGTARRELARLPVELHFLNNERRNDKKKQQFLLKYAPKHVAAFGNGTIDRLLLKTVRDAGGLAVAVDNGDPTSFEPFQASERKAFNGLLLAVVRTRAGKDGTLSVRAEAEGLEPGTVTLESRR